MLSSYNNTRYGSIGLTPVEARQPQNYGSAYFNLYGSLKITSKTDKFNIGDAVRISKYKRKTFDKRYTPNWTEEVFIIDKLQFTYPITYKIRDQKGEPIKGTFCKEEFKSQTKTSIDRNDPSKDKKTKP